MVLNGSCCEGFFPFRRPDDRTASQPRAKSVGRIQIHFQSSICSPTTTTHTKQIHITMSMLLQSLAPRVAQRTPALVATRSLATTSVRCNQGSSSSSSAAGVPTPANSSSHYGSRGDESQGRNLPAEQKSRHDHAIDASITSDAPRE